MARHFILIADDDAALLSGLSGILQEHGHLTKSVNSGPAALAALGQGTFHLAIASTRLERLSTDIRKKYPGVPLIVLMEREQAGGESSAKKAGAVAVLKRQPLDLAALVACVNDVLPPVATPGAVRTDRSGQTQKLLAAKPMLGQSPAWQSVRRFIDRFAVRKAPVLVLGERGTGKELVARALHDGSGRNGFYVTVNCAALPENLLESELFGHTKGAFTGAHEAREGLFEYARGGSVLLDEINAMPAGVQAKLLRFLQDHQVRRVGANRHQLVDVRVLAASNENLATKVKAGTFRADLFDRLDVLTITLPPLRERGRAEVELFITAFLKDQATVAASALDALLSYPWPGNVRELESALERAVALCDGNVITLADLPQRVGQGLRAET